MSDSPDLLAQLVKRTLTFKERTGLTSRQIGTLVGITEQHVCDLLAGRKGLSVQSTMRLLQVMNANRKEIEMKLGKPQLTSQIIGLQEGGEKMQLDSGSWTPKEGGSDDP